MELIFSRKKIKADHSEIFFSSIPEMKVEEHKHLRIMLGSKLTCYAHIKSAISKSRKGIGLLKYLSKYLPKYTLNELYKLYVRPHLDYGDVIYRIILLLEQLREHGEEHHEKSFTQNLDGNH